MGGVELVVCSLLDRADEGFFFDYLFAFSVAAPIEDLEATARARLVVNYGAIAGYISYDINRAEMETERPSAWTAGDGASVSPAVLGLLGGGVGASVSPAVLGLLGGGVGASVSPAVLGLLGGERSFCLTRSAWTARRRRELLSHPQCLDCSAATEPLSHPQCLDCSAAAELLSHRQCLDCSAAGRELLASL